MCSKPNAYTILISEEYFFKNGRVKILSRLHRPDDAPTHDVVTVCLRAILATFIIIIIIMSDNEFTTCSDGHKCFNGSLCTQNPYDEGSYYCDCQESFLDNAVAGLSCEHVATSYCTYNQEVSMTSFCTNHGTCKAMVSSGEAHLGCDCPPQYEGAHCQFVKGTLANVPNTWPGAANDDGTQNWSGGKEKLSGGVTAVIVLVCLGLVGAVGYFVYNKKKKTSSTTVIASPDLQLEADGEVLQRAVQSGVHNNGNGASAAEHELDADGDVLKEAVKSKSPSAIVDSTSMEEIDVSSNNENGGRDENGDRDENGGGGIV